MEAETEEEMNEWKYTQGILRKWNEQDSEQGWQSMEKNVGWLLASWLETQVEGSTIYQDRVLGYRRE